MDPREPIFEGDYSFNTGKLKQFSVVDYVLFGGILFISASIGFYFAIVDRKKLAVKDFLLAGKNMNPFPVALSLLGSYVSAITLLGMPAEMYYYTTMYWYIGLGYLLVIAGAAHLYIPVLYRLEVTSAYEYLERRFSCGVRTAASVTYVTVMILYMAIVLYAPTLALNAVSGFSTWGTVVTAGIVCILYTTFGGTKAVLWTESFQVGIMIASLTAVLIRGMMVVGDWDLIWESAKRTNRVWFTDFRMDPSVRHGFWPVVFGTYFTWVSVYGANQSLVQRCITCPTLKTAQLALWLNWPGFCLILFLCCLIGLTMGAFYENCDPLKAGFVADGSQMLPIFVMDALGDVTGLPGLFVAGLFSGALSTISSGLNAITAAILEDVIKTYIVEDMKMEHARRWSQGLALTFGVIVMAMSYIASVLGSVLQAALSIFGMVGGPVLGLFTLGMFFPWANKWGAYSGLFASLAFMFWIGFGAAIVKPSHTKSLRFTHNCNLSAFDDDKVEAILSTPGPRPVDTDTGGAYHLYTLSYLWYSATAVLTCLVVGLAVSFATGATKASEIDPRLMVPAFDIIFPFSFLPEKIRKPLRLGVDYSKTQASGNCQTKHTEPNTNEGIEAATDHCFELNTV